MAGTSTNAARHRAAAVAGVAALATAAGCFLAPSAASARSRPLIAPHGLRVIGVTKNSFTVAAHASGRRYRLWAAFRPRELATVRIHRTAVHSASSDRPVVTLNKLRYTARPYYYRVEVSDGWRHRFSPIQGTVGLQPSVPTGVTATSSALGTSLSWAAQPAGGFTVRQATDAGMTKNVKTYQVLGQEQNFTPPDLQPGTTYYFQVQAVNDGTSSPPSAMVSVTPSTDQQPIRAMTYNIRRAAVDGIIENGTPVAPWALRRAGAISLIQGGAPDVLAVQEGAAFVGINRTRQVDDLVTGLGDPYRLAQTEIAPNQPGHSGRTGVYIVYNSSTVTPVDAGGHWQIGDGRWAAYQVFRAVGSGAEFLFVSAHLQVPGAPGGTDAGRLAEDQSMVAQANQVTATYGGLPIIYGGDFNSDPSRQHEYNAPSDYNLAHGMTDSFDVAQRRTNAQYNSANGYQATPPAAGLRIDYVYETAGVAATRWGMLLPLANGKFAGVIPSDHNPVVADLLVPYAPVS